jgi:hypothetical protein
MSTENEVVAELDARALRAWPEPADRADPDGDLVLVVTDGTTTVRFATGWGREDGPSPDLAIYGMERLALSADHFAQAMRVRSGLAEPKEIPWAGAPVTGPKPDPEQDDRRGYVEKNRGDKFPLHTTLNGP